MRLEVEQMTGGYIHNYPVLHDIDFTVAPGQMTGIIGLNGAGKSTLMKHILGLMSPQKGAIRINGIKLEENPEKFRQSIAYVPETPNLFEHLTVRDHLRFTAMSYQLEEDLYRNKEEELLEIFRMKEKVDALPRHLSKGMQQKTMLMCAFITNASLFIIDEPFLGLDPLGITNLLKFMVAKKGEGASIFLSSHILSTIQNYCEEFVLLHKGRVQIKGRTSDHQLEPLFNEIVQGNEII